MGLNGDIVELFRELLDLTPAQRGRYYAEKGIDPSVAAEVESLLTFDENPAISIDAIVQRAVSTSFHPGAYEGESCGSYRLLKCIGEGGMGVVYLAERNDGEVRQHAAIKLLRAGFHAPLDRQRFLQERQILATLTHPNIARLIDAGHRENGQPYLVMEYIDGTPIDVHCGSLPVRARVSLMIQICDAVAYAHQKLVIHRDLKPANILVEKSGVPKLLDFGIAKFTDIPGATRTIERRLTPAFASPEQLRGETVGTASDIYSLGSVLRSVFGSGVSGKAIDRDLDSIVLKAMRDEPGERYLTADRLADDLRAWLNRSPVSARQGERWYRARRYMRRYWVPVAAVIIAFAGLAGGLVIARQERDIAHRRFREVRQLAGELFLIEKEIQPLSGATAAREHIVRTSLEYLERVSKEAGSDADLKSELAAGYRKVAEVQGVFGGANLGHAADAEVSLRKAELLFREVWEQRQSRADLRNLIETVHHQSRVDYGAKRLTQLAVRIAELRTLLATYESQSPDDPLNWAFLGGIYDWLAAAGRELNQMDHAASSAKRSIELRRKLLERDPQGTAARGSLANSLVTYARFCRATGELEEALRALQEALGLLQQVAAAMPGNYNNQLNLANTYMSIGRTLGDGNAPSLGRTSEALPFFEQSLRAGRQVMASDRRETHIRYNHSVAAWRLGDALRNQNPAAALAAYDEAIATSRSVAGNSFGRDVPLAIVLAESTFPLRRLGRSEQARQRLQESAVIAELYRHDPSPAYLVATEAISRAEADWAMASARPADAVALHRGWLQRAEAVQPPMAKEAQTDFNSAFTLAERYRLLAEALHATGQTTEAVETESKRREVIDWWMKKLPHIATVKLMLSLR